MRHPKESAYFTLAAVAGVIAWLFLIWIVILIGWIIALPLLVLAWFAEKFFRAQLLGNSVRVSETQFPEIHEMARNFSARLGLTKTPDLFIVNGNGLVNALAIRHLRNKYILLMSDLVDLLLSTGSLDELGAVVGHELGHHALGHTSPLKNFFLFPGLLVPFLGSAYSRACELSADRAGMWLAGSKTAAIRALGALACGSRALTPRLNIDAFVGQEQEAAGFFGFLINIYSSHPRLTLRVQELRAAEAAVLGVSTA
ncbi:MAG: M48 family metallopeptidase [Bryobacteraceae bacterium]